MSTTLAGQKKGIDHYLARTLAYILFIGWAFATIYPLIWMTINSFKTNTEFFESVFALPGALRIENYVGAWEQANLGILFVNSVIYSASTTFFILMLAMMMSYAFAKLKFKKLSKFVKNLVGLGILISPTSILIPLFLMLRDFGLLNSHLGVILVYTALGLPIATYLGTEYVKGIPSSLVESAYIDGASNLRMFISIILPLTVPVMITIGILNILGVWNEFLLVFVLTNSSATRSLSVGVYSFSSLTNTQYGRQLAALVIAMVPVIIIYLSLNSRITKGVVAGAIKG